MGELQIFDDFNDGNIDIVEGTLVDTMLDMIYYLRTTYINGTNSTVEQLSIVGRPADIRTNQPVEGFHKKKNKLADDAAISISGTKEKKTGESWLLMARVIEKHAMNIKETVDRGDY